MRGNLRAIAAIAGIAKLAAVRAHVLEKIAARIPVGRLCKAEEIVRGVLFQAAEDRGAPRPGAPCRHR